MAITFLEAGTSATFGFEFWDATAGAGITSEVPGLLVGPRKIQCAGFGSAAAAYAQKNNILGSAGGRLSFYFYPVLLPAGAGNYYVPICFVDAGGVSRMNWSISTGGGHAISDGATFAKTGSSLSVNTLYRIVIAWAFTSTTSYTVKVFVNGVLDLTVTAADHAWATLGFTHLRLGQMFLSTTLDLVGYFESIYVDDVAALTHPGDIQVTAKLPAAVATGGFNASTGTHAVNERPINQSNAMEHTAAATPGVLQTYTLETASAGDLDISGKTVVGRTAWLWSSGDTSINTKLVDHGGVETGITNPVAPGLVTLISTSATYPTLIGMRSSEAPNTFLYECGTVIAFLESGGATPSGRGSVLAETHHHLLKEG